MSENKSLKLSLIGLDEDERKRVLEVAECLVGSTAKTFDGVVEDSHMCECPMCERRDYKLIGVSCEHDEPFVYGDSMSSENEDAIALPLATLKVCPWMCAKYGVWVTYKKVVNGRATVVERPLNTGNSRTFFMMDVNNGDCVQDLKLDLSNLPKGVTLCQQ